MKSYLYRELSEGNIMDYIESCGNLAHSIEKSLSCYDGNKRINTIILPSRGAVPPFGVALQVMGFYAENGDERSKELLECLYVPETFRTIIPESVRDLVGRNSNYGINVLLLPYTADFNLDDEDEKILEKMIESTRKYWNRIAINFKKPFGYREDSIEFQYFLYILEEVEGRSQLADEYRKFPEIEDFLIIDTVISGRASTTILSDFEDLGIFPEAHLLVDRNGSKLKKEYRSYLENRYKRRKTKFYKMNRLFTEDRGSSFLGVVSVMYPDLVKEFSDIGKIMPGTWYPVPEYRGHKTTYAKLQDLMNIGIKVIFEGSRWKKEFEEKRKEFIRELVKKNLLKVDGNYSEYVLESRINPEKVYETSSHVMQPRFKDRDVKRIINRFYRKLHSNRKKSK